MDLVSRSNNFFEKRDLEMGFAVMCSPMHKFVLRMRKCVRACARARSLTHTSFKHTPCTCITYLRKVTATVSMMASVQQKAQCVTWLAKSTSTATVQCNFCHTCGRDPSVSKAIWFWFNQFKGSGTVKKCTTPGQPWVSEEHMNLIRLPCQHTPQQVAAQTLQLVLSKTTIRNVLHHSLRFHTYKLKCCKK
jgi:hypothetical protein